MKPSMKKTLSIALVAALALGLFAAFPQTAKAAPPTNYWDPVSGSLQAIPGVPIQIVATMTSLTNGWYYVDDTITTTGIKIAAGQDVNIVLCTGAVWTANGSWGNAGIGVPSGTKLTIYADAQNGSGSVTATGGYCGAGIGGGDGGDGGTITINGGNVTAQGDSDGGAGIGGGGSSSIFGGGGAGTVTIRGGMVNATGGSYSAGIGGGGSNGTITGGAGTVTISGGTVTATSGSYSAGIGGGGSSFGGGAGTVTISGGTVIATGSSRGAGIGGGGSNGSSGGAGMVTISGGAVTATGGSGGAGIGGGFFNNGAVTITTSGSVVAQGGEGGAGIGSGATNLASIDTGRVFITSAVTATGGAAGSGYTEGAAIGTGGTGATGSWAASATRVTYSQNTDGLGGGQALSVYCFEGRSDQVPKDTELELASPGFTTPLAGNSINTFNNQPDGSGGHKPKL